MKKNIDKNKYDWSIRMRASKNVSSKQFPENPETSSTVHISGAEGIYEKRDINTIVQEQINRALSHPKGRPDKIVITVEKIRSRPLLIAALPVSTIHCSSVTEAENNIVNMLKAIGISERAITAAFRVLTSDMTMRGASLVSAKSGKRVEPDRKRGVRVSRMGVTKKAADELSLTLEKAGLNINAVKEALVLASKVAGSGSVVAELCVSDDPDYTTGYIASQMLGYRRITNIKKKRDKKGGRIFFLKEDSDAEPLITYLEKIPVLINKIK